LYFAGKAQSTISNTDVSKVSPYTLPDFLKMENGKEVKNSKEWNTLHCPNTYHLYEEDQFGKYAAEKIALKYCSLEKRNML
jgi:hypothetical protein